MRPADRKYAWLLAGQLDLADSDALPALQEWFARDVRPMAGFGGGVLLRDAETATVLLVTLWETEELARSAGSVALPAGVQPLPHSGAYEVAQLVGAPGGVVARVYLAELRDEPGVIDRGVGLFQNLVLHAATAQSGFLRGVLLVDRVASRAASIGVWSSSDNLAASEERGYLAEQLARFADLLAAPPVRLTPEVIAED